MNLRKNEIIKLKIDGMSAEGNGVGRYMGIAIFVPLTAIGDTINARILKVFKSYAFAKIEKIFTASKDRIETDCPYFSQCGGCSYRHISYKAETKIKEQRVSDAITRIGGIENANIMPIISAANRDNYRNKALIPLGVDKNGEMTMGFYAVNSHRIIDTAYCQLQPDEFNTAMAVFRDWAKSYGDNIYNETTHEGIMRRLYLRKAEKSGEIMVCVVVNADGLKHEAELVSAMQEAIPNLKSVVINTNKEKTNVALGKKNRTIFGTNTITDELCGLNFEISPLSFYQINRNQTEKLYEKAREYAAITDNDIILDLYCGTGTIGLSMAKSAKKLIGVEIIEAAVKNARKNAENNDINNAEFICADAAESARLLIERGETPDVIIIDPPRKGCSNELIHTIADFQPKRLVYISCDPATLARDLKIFDTLGFSILELTPVDMFPATPHVECVVLMSRKDKV